MTIIKSNKGFSLVELTVVVGLIAGSLAAASSIVTMVNKSSVYMDSLNKQTGLRSQIINQLVVKSNWQKIVLDSGNSNMTCLSQHTDCKDFIDKPQPFRVVDANGAVVYDAKAADGVTPNGFTLSGTFCTNYGPPNDSCPYHYDLTWEPLCTASNCIDPVVQVKGKFSMNFAEGKTKAPNSTDFEPMSFTLNMNSKKQDSLFSYPEVYFVNWNSPPAAYTPFTFTVPSASASLAGLINLTLVKKVGKPGSTITSVGNVITYTPPANFYGIDYLDYDFEGKAGGKGTARIWFKVMTPYTWVGDGGDDTKTSNANNWCGVVVDQKCSHNVNFSGNMHFVFNQNCNLCGEISYDSTTQIDGLEISPEFTGIIKLNRDLNILTLGGPGGGPKNPGYAHQGFYQGGGVFEANGFNVTNQTGYDLPIVNPQATNFYIQAGTFNAPPAGRTLTAFSTGLKIDSGATFNNNGGLVYVTKLYGKLGYIKAPGVQFNDLKFDGRGDGSTRVDSSLNVQNFLYDGMGAGYGSICGPSTNKIKVLGNIKVINGGTNFGCGWGQAPFKTADIQIIMEGTGLQTLTGKVDSDPAGTKVGNLTNLVINNTTVPVQFFGQFNVDGHFQVLAPFDAGTSRVDFSYGSYSSSTNSHFYDIAFTFGYDYTIKSNVYVDHDMFWDRCSYASGFGAGCSVHGVRSSDLEEAQIKLGGDLHLISGGQDINSANVVVVEFVGTRDQSILGESTSLVRAPSIKVNKSSGSFSLIETTSASIAFSGNFDIIQASSVTITGTDFYFGYSQCCGVKNTISSVVPLDFGSAILRFESQGTYDLSNTTLKAGSLYILSGKIKNGTLIISGDISSNATTDSSNITTELVGGGTHNYTGGSSNTGVLTIHPGNTLRLQTSALSYGTINLNGTLDQGIYELKGTIKGNGVWHNGHNPPQNYSGSRSDFTGIID